MQENSLSFKWSLSSWTNYGDIILLSLIAIEIAKPCNVFTGQFLPEKLKLTGLRNQIWSKI